MALRVRHAAEPHIVGIHSALDECLLLLGRSRRIRKDGGRSQLRYGQGIGGYHVLGRQSRQPGRLTQSLLQSRHSGVAGDCRTQRHIDQGDSHCGNRNHNHDLRLNLLHFPFPGPCAFPARLRPCLLSLKIVSLLFHGLAAYSDMMHTYNCMAHTVPLTFCALKCTD